MSEFICKKSITLSGRNFSYGEVIPDGFVLPERALSLMRSNYITEVDAAGTEPHTTKPISVPQLIIPIYTEQGVLELTLNPEIVVQLLIIMQKSVEEAAKEIGELENRDALLLLHAVDSRKGVQKAAEERNAQLQREPEANTES